MCGLFGIAGPGINHDDLKALKTLTIFSILRGEDSTGFFKVNLHGKKQEIIKDILPSPLFLMRHKDFIDDYQTYFIMGHVRDSTVGAITKENAHPFLYSGIAGAHNGTLYDDRYRIIGSGKTDSELLFADINANGVEETLSRLDGDSAYAVSVYHRKDYSFTLARSRHRPLHVAINQKRSVVYWASEFEMLELALNRCLIEAEIYELQSYRSYRIPIDDIKTGNNSPWKISKLTENSSTKKPRKRVVHGVNYGSSTSYASYTEYMGGRDWDDVPFEPTVAALKEPEESCILCGREMFPADLADPGTTKLEVGGVDYYTCKTCNELEGKP